MYAASSLGYITDNTKDKIANVYTKSSYISSYELIKISGKAPTNLYAQVGSSVSKIKVTDIDLGNDCNNIKIYKGSTEIDLDEEIKISSSVTLKVKAYSRSILKIEKEGSSLSSSDDDIYLDDLSLTYDINVNDKVSCVDLCAEPEDEDYTVKINGSTVTDDDDWKKKVSLSEGKNTVTVKMKDNEI